MGRSTKSVGSSKKGKNFCGECGTDLREHVCHAPISIPTVISLSPPTPCTTHCYCQNVYVGFRQHSVCCKCGDRTANMYGITWSGTSPYYTIASLEGSSITNDVATSGFVSTSDNLSVVGS